jgi:hypothetical protein
MKYYLLTFNDDYADEHNVPALECFNEKDYEKWLSEPAGKLNPKYDEIKKEVDETEARWKKFWKDLEGNGFTIGGHANAGKIPKGHLLEREFNILNGLPRSYSGEPQKIFSYMSASLGNGGEGFDEGYSWALNNKDFVEKRGEGKYKYSTVTVMEVGKEFYDTFKKANLSGLSLCNIFEFKADKWIDDDEGEE